MKQQLIDDILNLINKTVSAKKAAEIRFNDAEGIAGLVNSDPSKEDTPEAIKANRNVISAEYTERVLAEMYDSLSKILKVIGSPKFDI